MALRLRQSRSLVLDGRELSVTGTFVKVARLADEWYEDLEVPGPLISGMKAGGVSADIFTFWQRLPDITPKHPYHTEFESIAALPVTGFDDWLKRQLNPKARNLLRKAEKSGVVVRPASFDDSFVAGMTEIFNETPVRQQKPFWHYGKTAETVKREFSRYLFREDLFGAYHGDELIGFIFLAYAGRYAALGQIISKVARRHMAPNNALIAKAVEVCAQKRIPHLVYAGWSEGSLGHFKRQNGFERFDLPRYYVPLTPTGRLALHLRLHRGAEGVLPTGIRRQLVNIRNRWYSRQGSAVALSSGE